MYYLTIELVRNGNVWLIPFHEFIASHSVVGFSGLLVVFVSFAQDQLVVAKTEGISV